MGASTELGADSGGDSHRTGHIKPLSLLGSHNLCCFCSPFLLFVFLLISACRYVTCTLTFDCRNNLNTLLRA